LCYKDYTTISNFLINFKNIFFCIIAIEIAGGDCRL